ncbi:MAG: GNAT family N-acetyltransferase [Acidobacteria bacterium]|nr:GNAT family N-acetyltransferase [Acidobacteriota bacterium]
MTLVEASTEQVREVLERTHSLWSEGLPLAAYQTYWLSLLSSPWGRRNLRYLLWHRGSGQWLSSFKLYTLRARCEGKELKLAGIGAVFTPEEHRSHGHARAMLLEASDLLSAEAFDAALLFSDIGTRYYQDLGFQPLPSHEFRADLVPEPPPGGLGVPAPGSPDWVGAERVYEDWSAGQPYSMLRDHDYWDFLRLRRLLKPPASGVPACTLHLVTGGPVYVLAEANESALRLMESVGSVNRLRDAMARLIGWARTQGVKRIQGWWRDEYQPILHGYVQFEQCRRTSEVAMIAPLSPEACAINWEEVADPFFRTDHF